MEKLNSLMYRSGRIRYLREKEIKKKNSDPYMLLRLKGLLLRIDNKLKTSQGSHTAHGLAFRPLPIATNMRR